MDKFLQLMFIMASLLFFIFIVKMIRRNNLNLRYTLIWIITSIIFVILSAFPGLLKVISLVLHIKEPVNGLFLIINFFLLLNLFTLTIALSRSINKIKSLAQELGITNLKLRELEKKIKE